MQLNDAANVSQDISFEDKMARYHVQFRNAPDAIKARMLQEINRELDLLTQQNHEDIQDAPQMSSQRRTFGQGGRRQHTSTEVAETALDNTNRKLPGK